MNFSPQNFLDAVPHVAALLSAQGTIEFVNSRWTEFGRANGLPTSYSALGASYLEVCPPELKAKMKSVIDGIRCEAEYVYTCHSETEQRWFRAHVSRVMETAILVVHIDVSEEERRSLEVQALEQARQLQEEKFRLAFERAPVGISLTTLDGVFLETNETFARVLGFQPHEIIGQDFRDLTHPDDLPRNLSMLQKMLNGTVQSFRIEKRYLGRNGVVWMSVSAGLLCDPTGAPQQIIAISEDITDQLSTLDRIKRNKAMLSIASQMGRLGGWEVKFPEQILTWTPETYAIHELDPNAPVKVEDGIGFYIPEDQPRIRAAFDRCVRAGIPYDEELQIITAKGRQIWIRSIGQAQFDSHGRLLRVHGAFQDIDQQKRVEQSLKLSEERFRLFSNASSDAIWDWDAESDTMWWNDKFVRTFGVLPGEDLSNYKSMQWFERIHPDDIERIKTGIRAIYRGHQVRWSVEYRCLKSDGTYASVADRALIIRNSEGKVQRVVGGISDLTRHKELEEQLLRAQRLESVGTLAGGVAHDLNNIFTPIVFSTQLIQEAESIEELTRFTDVIQSCAHRGTELVKQLLTFAKGTPGAKITVQMVDIVEDIAKIIRETFPKSIESKFEIPEQIWRVQGDPSQLHQVLLNLVVNARDAMPRGGELNVSLENIDVDRLRAYFSVGLEAGAYVKLRVADTGGGMPPEVSERIFEPFFTTKPPGKGTGLGLAATHTIIKNHGGEISVQSTQGQGTVFEVLLPASSALNTDQPPSGEVFLPHGDDQLILVVDDEPPIRDMLAHILKQHGYRALLAPNGAEALLHVSDHLDEIALVITDMAMPIMDGPATIAAIRAIDPRIPIIGTSGFTDGPDTITELKLAGFMPKPYTIEALIRMVAKVLK